MKHGAALVLRRSVLGVDVETYEVVEFQAAFFPKVRVCNIRHHGPLPHT